MAKNPVSSSLRYDMTGILAEKPGFCHGGLGWAMAWVTAWITSYGRSAQARNRSV
jgi:hypothetical protein